MVMTVAVACDQKEFLDARMPREAGNGRVEYENGTELPSGEIPYPESTW
jgi:hypothetical protein